jgi:hypothetical protein
LRDDLEAAKNTLSKILEQQCSIPPREGMKAIQSLIDADRLEIIYNAPGCITPGELINRVLVALCRERGPCVCRLNDDQELEEPARNRAEIVVLNGLDHLDAKFPLCAAEKVFIPALTSLFRSHEVCSILISADAGAQDVNIGAVSDLVLNFSDVGAVDRSSRALNEVLRTCGDLVQRIEVEATRVAAGQVGGRWGILGRDFAGEMSFYPASVRLAEVEEFSI